MKKEEIEKFYEKNEFDYGNIDKEYDGNWENPPIPEGKRIIYKTF